MTIRERMMAVYRNQRPDRVPVAVYSRYLPRGSGERMARELGLGIIDWYPVASLLAPPWHLDSRYLSEVKGAELSVGYAWREGRRVETRTYRTPVGTVRQESTVEPGYGSDWVLEHYVKGLEDYKVLAYLAEHTVFRRHEAGLRARTEELGEDGVVLGRIDRNPYQKVLIELAGPERFLIDLATDPGPAVELLEALARRMEEVLAMALESQAEVIWQPDNLTADMTPPAAFRKHCLPMYQQYGSRLQAAGKRYMVHMDGRLGPLKDLIAGAPVDLIESFSLPLVGGDLPLAEARAAWPGKVILPNFPATLCLQSDEAIEAFLDRLLAEAGTQGPWMLQFSEDIPAGQWQRVMPLVCRFMEQTFPGERR